MNIHEATNVICTVNHMCPYTYVLTKGACIEKMLTNFIEHGKPLV